MKRRRGIPLFPITSGGKPFPPEQIPALADYIEEHMNPKNRSLPFPVALVSWLDTWQDVDWVKIRQARSTQPYACKGVGFLIHRDKKRIVLAPTMGDGACDRTVIPMGAVTAVEILRLAGEQGA